MVELLLQPGSIWYLDQSQRGMELAINSIRRMGGRGGSREQLQEDCTAHPGISTITIMESLLAMLG